MLMFFPTPYPDEWWYSVLCRYHVRSGNVGHMTTVQELFSGHNRAAISSVFPNNTIPTVVSQLPSDVLNPYDIINQNTLFPYYMRFLSLEEKERRLRLYAQGLMPVVTQFRVKSNLDTWEPQYCPDCIIEDRKAYGEAYWHMTHQIPYIRVCPKHKKRLLTIEELIPSHMSYTFYPLESQRFPYVEDIGNDLALWEIQLSKIMASYQSLPLQADLRGCRNIAMALANMGYEKIQCHTNTVYLNAKQLYHDMAGFFGEAFLKQVYGDETAIYSINRALKGELYSPNRLAVLQCFAGVSSEQVFSETPIANRYESMLTGLMKENKDITRKDLAAKLGVTINQVITLCTKYQIPAPWKTRETDGDFKHTHKISFTITDEDYSLLIKAREQSGIKNNNAYARECVLAYIKKKLTQDPE